MALPKSKTKPKKEFCSMKSMIYGDPKTGKSTFCSDIPGAIFAATEDGLSYLEVYSQKISSWDDMLQLCKDLVTEKHEFKTLVVDVIDILYVYCTDYVCKRENVKQIADVPYGGGYGLVKKEFLRVMNKINLHGMGLVFVSHSKVKEVKKKTVSYTKTDTSLPPSVSEVVCGFVDHIFYAYIDDDQSRLMRTKPTKYINAGDRSGRLPEVMNFTYQTFITAFNKTLKEV